MSLPKHGIGSINKTSNTDRAVIPANEGFDHKAFLRTLTTRPGVYRMQNAQGEVIYVGKARHLKRRVSSYFSLGEQTAKTQAMVAQICAIEITVTHTENEALILENVLIKSLKPRYNILYRDDKGYPYIHLAGDTSFPRLSYYRGVKSEGGRFFGPYPSAMGARDSINLLQKVFLLRQCEDSFFNHRSRPCLQYQIKRCTAPCVGLISTENYAESVRHATLFLTGKNTQVIDELVQQMEAASAALAYEKAAQYRDQIIALRKVQERQYVTGEQGNLDVVAGAIREGVGCVQVFCIREGYNLGNKTYYPRLPPDTMLGEMLSAFVAQHYLGEGSHASIPDEILINDCPQDKPWLEQALHEKAGHKILLTHRVRGERARWLALAQTNIDVALTSHLSGKATLLKRFEALQNCLQLEDLPQRIECFDISHTMGEGTVASCVVMGQEGPIKTDYRRFNIENITAGDDYAAMHQVLTRRYRRLKAGEGKMPDILLIDGGKGQLSQAEKVLEELQVDGILMIGVAKGTERKPGLETLFISGQAQPLVLPATSLALHLIQHVRDEAHRVAIQGHRQRRAKQRQRSPLEEVSGLGPKRRQLLLKQFGGLQGVSRAGMEDLANVKGISKALAQKIYDQFHVN